MKRYHLTNDDACHGGYGMKEFNHGPWVKWEDHKQEMEKKILFEMPRYEDRIRELENEDRIRELENERNKLDSDNSRLMKEVCDLTQEVIHFRGLPCVGDVGNPDCKGCFDPHCRFDKYGETRVKWQDTESPEAKAEKAHIERHEDNERAIAKLEKQVETIIEVLGPPALWPNNPDRQNP